MALAQEVTQIEEDVLHHSQAVSVGLIDVAVVIGTPWRGEGVVGGRQVDAACLSQEGRPEECTMIKAYSTDYPKYRSILSTSMPVGEHTIVGYLYLDRIAIV